ncbi:MAG: ribonuclease HI family protein [Candidatus Bathyarchaeota archaeon]|nr:MAG: ribonuclease HI family protein [Candidatus Bathyarchaeota archaeon]
MRRKVFLVTDGASRGNPGPSAIGFGIYDEDWKPLEEHTEDIGDATNNEAEYKALIKGLGACAKYCRGAVEHFTDSRLIAKQSSGEWVVRAHNLMPLAEEVFRKQLQFEHVTHRYMPRTDPKIQRIDELVNQRTSQPS